MFTMIYSYRIETLFGFLNLTYIEDAGADGSDISSSEDYLEILDRWYLKLASARPGIAVGKRVLFAKQNWIPAHWKAGFTNARNPGLKHIRNISFDFPYIIAASPQNDEHPRNALIRPARLAALSFVCQVLGAVPQNSIERVKVSFRNEYHFNTATELSLVFSHARSLCTFSTSSAPRRLASSSSVSSEMSLGFPGLSKLESVVFEDGMILH